MYFVGGRGQNLIGWFSKAFQLKGRPWGKKNRYCGGGQSGEIIGGARWDPISFQRPLLPPSERGWGAPGARFSFPGAGPKGQWARALFFYRRWGASRPIGAKQQAASLPMRRGSGQHAGGIGAMRAPPAGGGDTRTNRPNGVGGRGTGTPGHPLFSNKAFQFNRVLRRGGGRREKGPKP